MLGFLWAAMLICGFVTAIFTGKVENLTEAVLGGGKDAVNLLITMAAVVPLWSGIMAIGQKAGMIDLLKRFMKPILKWLFPTLPYDSKAMELVATNLAANFFGLGWAATSPGLMAMKELKKLNGGREKADKAMSMFLIINMSSIQLLSVNLIAYRASFSSANPAEITLPVLIATFFSSLGGILFAKAMERRCGK